MEEINAKLFDQRYSSMQLRNETKIKAKYGKYYTDRRLETRIFNNGVERQMLIDLLVKVEREIKDVSEIKSDMERMLECSTENMLECLKSDLEKRCYAAWQTLTDLEKSKIILMKNISDLTEAIDLDDRQLKLNVDSPGISFKIEEIKEEQNREMNDVLSRIEIQFENALKAKYEIVVARDKFVNSVNESADIQNFKMRIQMHEEEKYRKELQRLLVEIKENKDKAFDEMQSLKNSLASKEKHLMIAQTRLNMNISSSDEVGEGLKEEISDLKKIINDIKLKIDCAKSYVNELDEKKRVFQIDLERIGKE